MSDDGWQRVVDLYQAAQERTPEERSSFVKQAAAEDSDLRREIKSPLAQDDQSVAIDEQIPAAARSLLADNPGVQPGSFIGPYRVDSLLGVGGMGEVYRAHDPKLNRDVAIKILPAAFANDPDRLARFQREAQVLASLNHPNIAHIHGLEESNGVRALVMELVEGEDLAQLLTRGAIPIDEALPIAKQIAEALEAAHENGIIHRDLKPANIKVRPDGTIKVLDFGLAKAVEAAGTPTASVSMSPTITTPAMTQAGIILGTAAYMSPEQAKGRPADKRADIWAFGCVLYEMLTGQCPFKGEDVSDTLAAVLRGDPDWSALPRETPAGIHRLLRRCLAKDVRRRLPHIGVAQIEIDEALTEPELPGQTFRSGERTSMRLLWVGAGLLLMAIGALTAMILRPRPPAELEVVRFPIVAPDGATFGSNVVGRGAGSPAPQFAFAPDGRRLAYVMVSTGQPQLWVRRLDSVSPQLLPGTDDASFPFWSPDSRWIGFFAQGKLKRIEASGERRPETICEATAGEGGTWNRSGEIVFAANGTGPLSRVPERGGAPSVVTTLDPSHHEKSHSWPQFLPDGRHFLYLAMSDREEERAVYVSDIDSRARQMVLQTPVRVTYSPSGHLFFVHDGTLMVQPFDVRDMRLTGDASPIAEDLSYNLSNGRAAFSASDNGALAYRAGGTGGGGATWFDRTGARLDTLKGSTGYSDLRLSPDGQRLAFRQGSQPNLLGSSQNASDIWILDLARADVPSRFTFAAERFNQAPVWSPDGSRVAFSANDGGTSNLYDMSTAGIENPHVLLRSPLSKKATDWTKDGVIVFEVQDPKNRTDLWTLTSDGKASPFLQTPFVEEGGRVSPDGRWIAYISDEGGNLDVYVRSFPTGDRKRRVSNGGGLDPQWRQDSGELFYALPGGRLMAVEVKPGADFEPSGPKRVLDGLLDIRGSALFFANVGGYAVASNGQRFLAIERDTTTPIPITVVLNWPAELKK
jgi:Tol biopolymer transport system component